MTHDKWFVLGDARGTAFFTLGILQSIYHRLHNIIATELKRFNPTLDDEHLFQEAKRINVAIYQNNVYVEWLRVFVGINNLPEFVACGIIYWILRWRGDRNFSSS